MKSRRQQRRQAKKRAREKKRRRADAGKRSGEHTVTISARGAVFAGSVALLVGSQTADSCEQRHPQLDDDVWAVECMAEHVQKAVEVDDTHAPVPIARSADAASTSKAILHETAPLEDLSSSELEDLVNDTYASLRSVLNRDGDVEQTEYDRLLDHLDRVEDAYLARRIAEHDSRRYGDLPSTRLIHDGRYSGPTGRH